VTNSGDFENRLWSILNSLHEIIIIVFDSRNFQQNFVWADPLLLDKYGFVKNGLSKDSLNDYVEKLINGDFISEFKSVFNANGFMKKEFEINTPKGIFWQDISLSTIHGVDGSVSEIVCFIRDITPRKLAEIDLEKCNSGLESVIMERTEDLLRTKIALSALLDSIPDQAWFKDTEFRYMFVNKRFADFWGIYKDKVRGLTDFELLPLDVAKRKRDTDIHVLETGNSFTIEDIFTGKDGISHIFHTIITPITGTDCLIKSIIGVSHDVTDIRHMEKESVDRERLNGVIELAGAACHEMNQPLQAILGFAEIISMDSKDEVMNEMLGEIRTQALRLSEITTKLRNITKYETMQYLGGKIIDIDKSSNGGRR
jgi:PAS domain S-box-containing protein